MEVKEVMPMLLYADAHKAIEWLKSTWGFEEQVIVPGPEGGVAHAELTLGQVMVMVSSAEPKSEYSENFMVPKQNAGKNSQAPYVIVSNPDWFYYKAKHVNTKIIDEIADKHYGGRGFSCTDLEGHIWSFGSYDPRAAMFAKTKFMKKVTISAPSEEVWNAIVDLEKYKVWAKAFSPNSQFQGNWEKGSKMTFFDPGADGCFAIVEEAIQFKKIVIRHLGLLNKAKEEDTTSKDAQGWCGIVEAYLFESSDDGKSTTFKVEMSGMLPKHKEMLSNMWEPALVLLKKTVEARL